MSQCEAVVPIRSEVLGDIRHVQCENEATVETVEGDLYCNTHKDWNEE